MKRAVFAAMLGLCVLGWHTTIKGLVEKPARYRSLVAEGERYDEEKIYVKAIETYKEALTYQPKSLDLQLRIASDYLALGDETSFINRCNSVNESQGYPIPCVTLLADYYMENSRNEKAIALLKNAMKRHKDSGELKERYETLRYTYKNLYLSFEEILAFRNDSAVYKEGGLYGLLDTGGRVKIRSQNERLGALSGDREAVPVFRDGEYYYADPNGYRIEVPKEGQKVEELGVLCNGAAPAKINGKYGYINVKFEELTPFEWDGATVIQNGFGAVRQGEKWALISQSYELTTDFTYDDVKTDAYQYCSITGRAFVKEGDSWHMVDEKGNPVGEGVYEDAHPFVSEEPAAVEIGGEWGFVDADGRIVIEAQYEDAGSFSGGLAPVQTAGGWGYITPGNELVIAADFTEAKSFYKGVAPVKNGQSWTLIQLNAP